jgi:xanthine dehydrogenase small subunit
MSIFFLALNCELKIEHKNGNHRTIKFQEFHQNYKKYDLQKDEILKSNSISKLKSDEYFNYEKVSKRTHLDIASVNTALKISIDNDIIEDAYASIGGVAAIPKYLYQTSNFLIGKNINSEIIKEAETILQAEISPISDVRGTSAYKRMLAKQLFFAHFIELFPSKINLRKLIAS